MPSATWAEWKARLLRLRQELRHDNLALLASGVAFYGFLALFPGITAALSLYGLLSDPAELQRQIAELAGYLPAEARAVVERQLVRIAAGSEGDLTWGAALSIAVALWAATRGTKGMIRGINLAYAGEEQRGFVRMQVVSVTLTLGAIVSVAVALTLIAVLPQLLHLWGLPTAATLVSWLRWPLLCLLVLAGLAVLYHFAPARRRAPWRWFSLGSLVATALWLLASALFSIYVASVGTYNQLYGSVGGIVVLLLWLQITAYAVLLGAELNAHLDG